MPKEGSQFIYFSVILIDSVFRTIFLKKKTKTTWVHEKNIVPHIKSNYLVPLKILGQSSLLQG